MKHKKAIILTVIFTLLISLILVSAYEYNTSQPILKINNCLFSINGGLENNCDDFKELLGDEIGYIDEKTYLVPQNNNEGFKIPKKSKVYIINKDHADKYSYSVMVEIEDNYYIASLYIDNKDFTSKYLDVFDENF